MISRGNNRELQTEFNKIQSRHYSMYVGKLDGLIDGDFFEKTRTMME